MAEQGEFNFRAAARRSLIDGLEIPEVTYIVEGKSQIPVRGRSLRSVVTQIDRLCDEREYCDEPHDEVARLSGISGRRLTRCLRVLRRWMWIVREQRWFADEGRCRWIFAINWKQMLSDPNVATRPVNRSGIGSAESREAIAELADGTPSARQVTPSARQVTPSARQVTPSARQVTPSARQVTPSARQVTPICQESQRGFSYSSSSSSGKNKDPSSSSSTKDLRGGGGSFSFRIKKIFESIDMGEKDVALSHVFRRGLTEAEVVAAIELALANRDRLTKPPAGAVFWWLKNGSWPTKFRSLEEIAAAKAAAEQRRASADSPPDDDSAESRDLEAEFGAALDAMADDELLAIADASGIGKLARERGPRSPALRDILLDGLAAAREAN